MLYFTVNISLASHWQIAFTLQHSPGYFTVKKKSRHPNILYQNLTWEPHKRLVEDQNAPLIRAYLLAQRRKGRKLTIPEDIDLAGGDEGSDLEPAAPPVPQPPIVRVDHSLLLPMLIAPLGSEQPNGIHPRALDPNATSGPARSI